jgi:hypothetical protein
MRRGCGLSIPPPASTHHVLTAVRVCYRGQTTVRACFHGRLAIRAYFRGQTAIRLALSLSCKGGAGLAARRPLLWADHLHEQTAVCGLLACADGHLRLFAGWGLLSTPAFGIRIVVHAGLYVLTAVRLALSLSCGEVRA